MCYLSSCCVFYFVTSISSEILKVISKSTNVPVYLLFFKILRNFVMRCSSFLFPFTFRYFFLLYSYPFSFFFSFFFFLFCFPSQSAIITHFITIISLYFSALGLLASGGVVLSFKESIKTVNKSLAFPLPILTLKSFNFERTRRLTLSV